MPEQNGDKTQDPTPHRRQKAREQGQVAKSQDLASAALLLWGLMCVSFLGRRLLVFFESFSERHLGGGAWLTTDVDTVLTHWNQTMGELGGFLLPLFALMVAAAVAVNLMQVGFLFLPEKLKFDFARLDPLKGLRRMFSLSSGVRLGFGIFKIVVIATVALVSLYAQRQEILDMAGGDVRQIGTFMLDILWQTALVIGIALFILALLDYAFQRWKHEQDLKMTNQEVREEMKNLEGNPEVVARRKQVQRQLAMSRLATAVPAADLVVTNPTELAVAIQYDPETMAAPVVVAKGAGVIAQRIRQLALEHNIPIIEKKPLARALYSEVKVNHPIPADKYAAVAELLAYVYQLKGKPIPAVPTGSA